MPPAQVWDDLTALAGYIFSRGSAATDGSPETGLPADDVDSYAIDVLREVSAKLGLTAQPAYLLEGARASLLLHSNDLTNAAWVTTGTVTRTGGQTDPAGGTEACRLACASGSNLVNQSVAGNPTGVQRCQSQWVRQGAGTGAYAWLASVPFQARGGTAGVTWIREHVNAVSTGGTWAQRIVDGSNLTSFGGPAAGARDAVVAWPQMEQAAFPSSHVGTGASAVTRLSDNLRVTMPATWTTDVLTVEYRPAHTSAQFISAATTRRIIDDGTNRLSLVLDTGACKVQLVTSGGTYLSPALTYSAGDVLLIAVDWSALTLDVSVDGTPVAQTAITGSWSAGGTAYIGRDSLGTEFAFGVISIGGIR